VTDTTTARSGLPAFLAGLAAQGILTERRGNLVVYWLEPLVGGWAGKPVETGIAVGELDGWPTAPPHWIHVPEGLKIAGGQASDLPGWFRYSRPHPGRVDAAPSPAQAWVAHVREFLGHAP
jgi:hypothetical protein